MDSEPPFGDSSFVRKWRRLCGRGGCGSIVEPRSKVVRHQCVPRPLRSRDYSFQLPLGTRSTLLPIVAAESFAGSSTPPAKPDSGRMPIPGLKLSSITPLEGIAQAKLNNSRIPRGRDSAVKRVRQRRVRIAEIDAIDYIEELGAKLKSMAFKRHRKPFK